MPIVFARHPMIPIRRVNYVRRGMGDAASQCVANGGTWFPATSFCGANSPGVNPSSSPAGGPVDFTDPIAVVRAVQAGNPQALAAQAAYNAAAKASPTASSTAAALIAGGVDPYLAYLQTTGKMSGGDYNISPTGVITAVANPLAAVSFTPPASPPGTPVQSNAPSPAPVAASSPAQSNAPNAQPVSPDLLSTLKNAVSGVLPSSTTGNWFDGIPNWAVLAGGGLLLFSLARGRR